MTLFAILETILIGPLKLVFEIIFDLANRIVGHPGLAIIALSLTMNILVLPLYRRADAMQEEARETDAKLSRGIQHIKKTFSGDERMLILQTYYRQNHYSPLTSLNGSVSLLLEIPFFMAAYQFLSHVIGLNGVSFGPIADLSVPDGLIVIGGVAINLLPILMTVINVVSSAIYLRGFPLKTKLQLYGIALVFFVLLYGSPSCLVFYWTLNNVFSLFKNIFYKLKNPAKILSYLVSICGICILVFGACFYVTDSVKRQVFLIGLGLMMQLPLVMRGAKKYIHLKEKVYLPNKRSFWCSALFLTVFVGLYIPSVYISASPQEFLDVTYFYNPLWFAVSSFCYALGTFVVWVGVFYWLATPKGRVIFERLLQVACVIVTLNYMFFATNTGVISSALQYEKELVFNFAEQLMNLAVVSVVGIGAYFVSVKKGKAVSSLLLTACLAVSLMCGINIHTIRSSVNSISENTEAFADEVPSFTLSTEGENVIVLMLDRAISEYIPYIFAEKTELLDQFDGFTYYSNTISYGAFTNFGTPPLLGGYEYTPVEMNKRDKETLQSKHNEALLMMPLLFREQGYEVTVCDPVYANYQWIPDLSLFDTYPDIDAYITKGKFSDAQQKESLKENNLRNFFCFSVMKCMPLTVQTVLYNNGRYCQAAAYQSDLNYAAQFVESPYRASGLSSVHLDGYNVLCHLSDITEITQDDRNTFLFLANDGVHDPILLQEPEYVPAPVVDNTAYELENSHRFTINGKTLNMASANQYSHYQCNMAAMLRIGEWLDYLRECGVYDNTRIILVADHGRNLEHFEQLLMEDGSGEIEDVEFYYPLLMVKDFYTKGFTTSHEFMTNADVPTLAVNGLIDNPVNPFTGKAINNDEKTAHPQYIIRSYDWEIAENNGTTYLPAKWASVTDDLWERDNWMFYNEEIVLTEHKMPD